MVEDDHIIKKSKNNKMPLNLAMFLSDPRLYHLLLYCNQRQRSFFFNELSSPDLAALRRLHPV